MPYQVTVLPAQLQFTVDENENIVAAALRQGVQLPYGCRNGSCGACMGKLIAGSLAGERLSERYVLTAEERSLGFSLFCQAKAASDLIIESPGARYESATPARQFPVRVEALNPLSSDVLELVVRLPASETFRFAAGQYVDILTPSGERRSYSIANAPHSLKTNSLLVFHIRNQPGGAFSSWAFSQLKVRDLLRMHGPHGHFRWQTPVEQATILLASGTGFAPIKSIIEQWIADGKNPPTYLYWGGRRAADLYSDALVRHWQQRFAWFRYVPVLSEATADDQWNGRTGLVHRAVLDDFADLSTFAVYACGAPIVVESARRDFVRERALPENAFFADAFTPANKPFVTALP